MDLCTLKEELHQRDMQIEQLQSRLSIVDVGMEVGYDE